jgi:dTDP-4-dehydrorhamnose reductase
MRIAVIGADGQLGTDLVRVLAGDDVTPLTWPDFDVTRPDAAEARLRELAPEAVINTAAFHRVDECEDEVEQSFRVNAFAVRDLAKVTRELGAVLVHFSTDYVFDGAKGAPYVETDRPGPLNVYGVSKLAGEHFLRAATERFFLIRTCGLFGQAGCREKGRNFVEAMLHLAATDRPVRVVRDQVVTPTSTAELAVRVAALLRTEDYGLYHMTGEGECSWWEFARAIFELAGVEAAVEPVASADFRSRARRPLYSVLENARMREVGLPPFSPWRKALAVYLEAKGLTRRG